MEHHESWIYNEYYRQAATWIHADDKDDAFAYWRKAYWANTDSKISPENNAL